LAQTKNKFDVIFVDPPYQQGWVNKVLPLIKGVLAEGGLIYVEAEYAITDSDEWQVVKNGKAGNVFYHLVKPT
jgi:16S rRNA (guanine966-N2)-methyltransferase